MDKVFHMAGGEDEASYAKNSFHQRLILREVKPILMKGIEELLGDLRHVPNCFRVSDLGCSSGPNLFLTAESIIESLPEFYEKLAKESDARKFMSTCLISAMPGSFYGKLFPDISMHFLHSSYCLHWLSQVPKGLVEESGTLKNKGIYSAKAASPMVQQAYLDQFSQDFSKFLSMRSQELVHHGQLLLTFMCKNEDEPEGAHYLTLLNMVLIEMVADGHITEEKLDSFRLPYYEPSVDETRQLVENEGSFKIHRIHTFKTLVGARSGTSPTAEERARFVANIIRAVFGPILTAHFGEDLSMDALLRKYTSKLVDSYQLDKTGFVNNLVISLSKQ